MQDLTDLKFFIASIIRPIVREAVDDALAQSIPSFNTSITNEEIISAVELRKRLNICGATENAYQKAGLLEPQRLGRKVFYRWDKVQATLQTKGADFLPPRLRRQIVNKKAV